jgi:hypothetical protein
MDTAFSKTGRGVWKVDMVPNSDYDVICLWIMLEWCPKKYMWYKNIIMKFCASELVLNNEENVLYPKNHIPWSN